MVAIKGMKMPERCAECRFCVRQKTSDYGSYGQYIAQDCITVSTLNWSLPPSCPLQEIVTCKDCKNCYPDEDGRGYHCERDSNVRFSVCGNFYCAGGKRRE